uniref:Uncharacterized protein n=1 Tax=Ditylenchus dipsaci TaxID=166011 RepID=A0A915ENY6_9BILA
MLRLPSKLFMLRKIPNAHILFALQSRSKSDWFIDKAVQKAGFYGRAGPVTHMVTINRNSSTEQPPNWRSNLKADWDQLILEDKIKLLYYSIWAIIASGFMFLIFTPASDTDDEVRKKEMVDWECRAVLFMKKR